MPSEHHISHFLRYLLVALIGCFLLQSGAFYLLKWGTGKCESNYFSTLSRFQAAAQASAEVCVVGSSISGRLPGREVGNDGVANLGSDGGSPFDGITLLAEGTIPLPQWAVIEMNTLFNGIGHAMTQSVTGARGSWFWLGAKVPLLGAKARPSGMLYARLLNRDWKGKSLPFALILEPIREKNYHVANFDFTELEKERLHAVKEKLAALQKNGVSLLLVTMPAGVIVERDRRRMEATIAVLSSGLGAKHLDLETGIPREELHYTDSVHMGPASAARVLATIQRECRNEKK